eukprot:6490825-Amphidinium_carterae.2
MASVHSAGSTRKRNRVAGKTNAMVSSLASGLASLSEQDHEEHVEYIVERLNGEEKDLAGVIVRLMKNGTLRKAIAGDTLTAQEARVGKELAHGCDSLRGLRELFLWQLLSEFEPAIFNSESFETLPDRHKNKSFYLSVVTFGLEGKQSSKLPTGHPILRFEKGLGLWLKALYTSLGRRLRNMRLADENSFGPFSVQGRTITLNSPSNPEDAAKSLDCAALDGCTDWVWKEMWTNKVTLRIPSQGATLHPVILFKQQHGISVFSSDEAPKQLSLAEELYPAELKRLLESNPSAGSAASSGSAPPAGQGATAAPLPP